jgi:hypothetical protein
LGLAAGRLLERQISRLQRALPTIAFQQLFAFLVLGLDRRQLLWFAVTRNPTAEWLARQITEAFPWDSAPKYLIRDNDKAFGVAFKARVRAMGHPRPTHIVPIALAERIRRTLDWLDPARVHGPFAGVQYY